MKLVSFTIKNYRSITDGYKLPLGDFAVLVGPNNEGKSNILKAIVTALGLLSRADIVGAGKVVRYRYTSTHGFDYQWARDFPVALQTLHPRGSSEFVLEFDLSVAERKTFNSTTASNLTKNLKLKLSLGPDDARLDVLLQGKGKKYLTQHLPKIARFVADRLEIQYVPAVRTSEMAVAVVEELLSRELALLEKDPKYLQVASDLAAFQKPILERLAKELTGTVASFVPEVRAITLDTHVLRRALRHSCSVTIDDGTPTDLELKGDGVKSLTAISLIRHTSQKALGGRSLILAVEEPESHLHPRAIHRLREVLQEIAQSHQVVVTTHSPSLIDRGVPSRNIIVRGGKATRARGLREIREALGVEVADNLVSASLVLLLEGEADAQILGSWLPAASDQLKAALAAGRLVIDTLSGAANLRYKLSLYRTLVCNVHVFLDNDDAGRTAVGEAIAANVLSNSEYTQAVCQGMPHSEIEDLIIQDVYEQRLHTDFHVALTPKFMAHSKKAWSERVRDNFSSQGKPWTKALERDVKTAVAQSTTAAGLGALNPHRRGPIDALVASLIARLALK